MKNTELEQLINEKLNSAAISDYAPNGLQVEGKETVQKIVTGVTASQALLDEAVRLGADAVIVHHGYFWKGESPVIRGMKRNRLKTLLANDINLYGWHLPLDAHPELGNNAQLAALLGITVMGEIEPLVPWGELTMPVPGLELASWIEARLGRKPLWCGDTGPEVVQRVAWCTGGGQSFIDSAARFGVDAFITGEVSEQTIHSAREQGLHFYAAGHHATERGGIRALSEWLNENTDLDVTFIDIPVTLASQKRIWRLAQRLVDMPNVVEAIPGMNNITVILRNPESLALDAIERLQRWWEESEALEPESRFIEIPVVYGGAGGPDLAVVAAHCGLSEKQVVELHSSVEYVVWFLGFQPGFPYLGSLPEQLHTPRRAEPRLLVPAGSVGIGGPRHTSLSLFDPARDEPILLRPGDSVRFVPQKEGVC